MNKKSFNKCFDLALALDMKVMQHRDELAFVIQQIEGMALPPKNVLECGAAYCGWGFVVCNMCPSIKRYIGIDVDHKMPQKHRNMKFVDEGTLIDGSTRDPKVIAKVKNILNGDKLDIIHIDAEHTYDAAWEEFESYSPLVRPGGLIIFHDVRVSSRKGVAMFFREIMHNYFHILAEGVIEDKGTKKTKRGVGILRISE